MYLIFRSGHKHMTQSAVSDNSEGLLPHTTAMLPSCIGSMPNSGTPINSSAASMRQNYDRLAR